MLVRVQLLYCPIFICADVRDRYNRTILHDACSGGSLPVVQYLVEEVKCDVGESVSAVYTICYQMLCDS